MTATVTPIKPNNKIKSGTEYVSGSPYAVAQPRVLAAFDEIDARRTIITHEMIDAMLDDPDVYAGLMLLALMAMNEKLLITPAITAPIEDSEPDVATLQDDATVKNPAKPTAPSTDPKDNIPDEGAIGSPDKPQQKPTDPKVALAAEIADFCQRQIDRVPKFSGTMFELLFEGMAHGNKVAEQVLEIAQRGQDTGKWCLQSVKTKPREAVAFVVDAYMNILGMLGAKPGQMAVVQTTVIVDSQDIIPREKFVVFTYKPKNNDPRGTFALRAAVKGWELKQRTMPEYLLFLMVSAIPGILATLAPGADELPLYEDDGVTPRKDAVTGEPIVISAHQFLLNTLAKMRNHQVGVAPEGTEFTLLEANSDGEVFTRALDKFGSEITMAILFQQLATRDSKHQTKSATGSQAHVIDYIVWWLRDNAADMVKYDIFKPLVRYNYGDDAADELLPKCSYGDTEARDWSTDASAAASLANFLTDSQWESVTTQLGIPVPTEAEKAMARFAKQLQQKGQQQALQNNANGGDTSESGDAQNKAGNNAPATTTGK